MKSIKLYYSFLLLAALPFVSCSDEYELPEHNLDVNFTYELVCSEALLKYVTPQVTLVDANGSCNMLTIEENMWTGSEHKKWQKSVHFDRLDVSSTMSVNYVLKAGVIFEDEQDFDSAHDLSCLISVLEDGEGRKNNLTIIPDFPSKTNVSAEKLHEFVNKLVNSETTKGGKVGMDGEIVKIENN